MLMNNLDPDVAEKPNELVVYGGIGRAARTWSDFDRSPPLKTLGDDETLLVQSGKPVGVIGPMPMRRGCSSPTRTSCRTGPTGITSTSSTALGPDDVRPDDRRLVDLHRHAGHRAGHLRDLRRSRPQAFRRAI
jgi:hypothetical protein